MLSPNTCPSVRLKMFFMCFFLFFLKFLKCNLKWWCTFWRYQRSCCVGWGRLYFCQAVPNTSSTKFPARIAAQSACHPEDIYCHRGTKSKPVCLLLVCWTQICFPAKMVNLLSFQLLKQASQTCSEALQCFRKPETFACLNVSSAYARVLWRWTLKLLDGAAGISCLWPLLEECRPLEWEGTLGRSRHVPGLMGSFTEFKVGNGLDTKQVLTIRFFSSIVRLVSTMFFQKE